MPRLIVTLTRAQDDRIRRIARDRSTSMADVIRTAIDALPVSAPIGRAERIRQIIETSAGFHSGASDVAENHDEYLAEGLLDWRSS
jgi:hypothetical protein